MNNYPLKYKKILFPLWKLFSGASVLQGHLLPIISVPIVSEISNAYLLL